MTHKHNQINKHCNECHHHAVLRNSKKEIGIVKESCYVIQKWERGSENIITMSRKSKKGERICKESITTVLCNPKKIERNNMKEKLVRFE